MAAGKSGKAPAFNFPGKDDVYIFSYTSGTTGDSKGVKLTHNNVLSNARCSKLRIFMNPGEAIISYLPYTHSFEQILFGFAMMQQVRIGFYTGDPGKIVEDCGMLKPSVFPSVPRLYQRIYSKLESTLGAATGCKKWLVDRALGAKRANQAADGSFTHGCYDFLVFKKASALLGGNVRIMLTGSAPIDKQVIDFLKICFSCPIIEGYGLTESAAGSCVMDQEDPVTGHVGGPCESVKLRLKDLPEMSYMSTDKPYPRGEVCMKGPSIFTGYYKKPDKTAEAFDAEGWFLTGDVVQVYPNGSIKIIDRSKNIFKLSQGEYIAPEKIEQIMALSPLVAQCFIYGDSLKNACVCVIVPEEDTVKRWARENDLEGSFADLCKNADLKKAIQADMLRLAGEKKLSSLEKPREFILWSEVFSVDNDLLTSTFKLKRNVAAKVFKPQIDEMYVKVTASEAAYAAKARQ